MVSVEMYLSDDRRGHQGGPVIASAAAIFKKSNLPSRRSSLPVC
jgi:hypothetical protein